MVLLAALILLLFFSHNSTTTMTTVATTISRSRGATVTPVTNGAESDDPFGLVIIEDVPVAVV